MKVEFPTSGKFRKLPVVIHAEQIQCTFDVLTREGLMAGNPGDWLVTGVEGEQYPCADAIFRKTYEPVVEDSEK